MNKKLLAKELVKLAKSIVGTDGVDEVKKNIQEAVSHLMKAKKFIETVDRMVAMDLPTENIHRKPMYELINLIRKDLSNLGGKSDDLIAFAEIAFAPNAPASRPSSPSSKPSSDDISDLAPASPLKQINRSADQWELYSSYKGAGGAARRMNTVINKARAIVYKKIQGKSFNEAAVGKLLGEVYNKVVYPVQDKLSDWGAADTEPNYHCKQELINVVKEYFGIDHFTNLGDYF